MLKFSKPVKTGIAAILVAVTTFGALAPAALAQDRDHRDDRRDDRRGGRDNDGRDRDGRGRPEWRGDRHWDGPPRVVVVRPRPSYYRYYAVPRTHYYQSVRVYRPYGHVYPGFGFYYRDSDAFRFLGLTALSIAVFNQLNESQQRAHEEAILEATSAPIGEPITWNVGSRSGTVTAVRDGTTTDGRQCREFQQDVVIDGRNTQAYGTACLQPDGSWQTVNDD